MKIQYNNLYVHFVFTTLHRQLLITPLIRVRLEKYITGIVNNYASHLYSIYANPDHVHILVSKSPEISEQSLACLIADSSQRFINENKLSIGKFEWQESAAAFSVSKWDVDKICRYILNQPNHHRKISFEDEFQEMLRYYQSGLNKSLALRK